MDVLRRERGRRPRAGYERVAQRDVVVGQPFLEASFLAGALAALMRRAAHTPPSAHKLACLRRIIEGSGVDREETRQLLLNVVEAYLPLSGAEAERFQELLRRPENEGIRQTMKTWTEQQQVIGKRVKAQEDVLRVLGARFGPVPPAVAARIRQIDDEAALDALLTRAATAASLAEMGLP